MSMSNLITSKIVTMYSYPAIPLNLAIGFEFLLSEILLDRCYICLFLDFHFNFLNECL